MKGEDVIARLNEAFDYDWSCKVDAQNVTETYVVVKVTLSHGAITKEAFGGAQIMMKRNTNEPVDLGNAYKSAATNGIKKAAELFGIGLDSQDKPAAKPAYTPAPAAPKVTVTTKAHETPATAAATSTVRVEAPKNGPAEKPVDFLARAKALAAETALAPTPAAVAAPPAASTTTPTEAEKLAQALSALDSMKSGGTPTEDTPSPAPAPEAPQPNNPFATTSGNSPSDIQVNAIKKMCEKLEKTEAEVIALCVSLSKIDPTTATAASALSRKDAAAVIRHLMVME